MRQLGSPYNCLTHAYETDIVFKVETQKPLSDGLRSVSPNCTPCWRLWMYAVCIGLLPVIMLSDWSRGFSLIDTGFLLLLVVPASPILFLQHLFPNSDSFVGESFLWYAEALSWLIYISAIFCGLAWASRRKRRRMLSLLGMLVAALAVYALCYLILVAWFNRVPLFGTP